MVYISELHSQTLANMEYLRYYEQDGYWYPPSDANLSEHLHNVFVAGRSVHFRLREQMPKSYAIYWALESAYREETGGRAHIYHKLTDEQYKIVVAELEELIKDDGVDRRWMRRRT